MKKVLVMSIVWCMSLYAATPLYFEDENAIDDYLTQQFSDKELGKKIITIRSKPSSVNDIIDLIGLSAGIDFVIDADVTGNIGKINFEKRNVGDILQVLCSQSKPRLALFKQANVWHIGFYSAVVENFKKYCKMPLQQKIYYLKHVKCDETLKNRIEDMWLRISKQQRYEKILSQAYCSVDVESKKVFVYAPRRLVQEMERFIFEIDCATSQVRIDAIVVVVDSKYEHQLGFNWSGVYNRKSSVGSSFDLVGLGSAPKNSTSGNADNFALNLFTRATSALKLPIVFGGSDLSLQRLTLELRAAETQSKAKILLKPSVLTSHGETSEILIGRSIPIKTIVEDVIQGKLRNVQTVNYKDVGTILNVRPLVSPNKKSVLLDIWVEDSSVSESTAAEQAPVIKTIRTKNKVSLHSGQTTVIGGLMLNRDEMSQSEMPVLSKIPIIGRLFQGKQKTLEDNQLLIFITPTIVA